MPTNKQRREAAQRRLQRQLERREQVARKRRRTLLVLAAAVAVLVVVGAAVLIAGIGSDEESAAAADPSASPTPSSSAAAAPAGQTTVAGPCTFTTDGTASSGVPVTPPSGDIGTTGSLALTMATADGPIGLTLDRATAPCAVASFDALTRQGYFDGTPCHRETASAGLKVLQCGDPSGSGSGGPGYSFPTQVTGSETYARGTVAMANSGQGTDGSQFFLVYGDSQLQPDYTVVGTIDQAGLAVLDTIAARGIEGGAQDGAPAQPVTIETMTVAG